MATEISLPDNLMRAQKPLRWMIEIGLIVLVAIMLARLGWLIAAPQDAVSEVEARPLPSIVGQAGTALTTDRTLLIQTNPFETEATVVELEAPETQLNLRLAGLIMSTGEGGGSAQITTPDNRTNRYVLGDDILPGVRLERILSDRVILSRNGEDETLMFGRRGEGLSVISDGNMAQTERQITARDSSASTASQSVSEGNVSSPQALLQAARLAPVETDGVLKGYALSIVGSEAIVNQAGLQQGDILIEVNGTSVIELDMTEFIEEISASSTANLRIERGGVLQTVRLRFEG